MAFISEPDADELDSEVVLKPDSLLVYRLVKKKYADLSGLGSAYAPGRWNRAGEQALYTSVERSTAVLEKLAHVEDKNLIPSDLVFPTIRISGDWFRDGRVNVSSVTKAGFLACPTLAKAESERTKGKQFRKACAIAVPSVIVPVWNVVLYPQRVGFWQHVAIERTIPYVYDARLFPSTAKIEQSNE